MINPGIKAALNPIAFQGGPFTIHWYGVIIASGVVLALLLAVREGKREGIPEDDFYDYLLWALPIADNLRANLLCSISVELLLPASK